MYGKCVNIFIFQISSVRSNQKLVANAKLAITDVSADNRMSVTRICTASRVICIFNVKKSARLNCILIALLDREKRYWQLIQQSWIYDQRNVELVI